MMFKSKEIKQESRVEISSNVLLSVCVLCLRGSLGGNSVSSSQNAHVNSGF